MTLDWTNDFKDLPHVFGKMTLVEGLIIGLLIKKNLVTKEDVKDLLQSLSEELEKRKTKFEKEEEKPGLKSVEYYDEIQRKHGWLRRQMEVQLDSGIVD